MLFYLKILPISVQLQSNLFLMAAYLFASVLLRIAVKLSFILLFQLFIFLINLLQIYFIFLFVKIFRNIDWIMDFSFENKESMEKYDKVESILEEMRMKFQICFILFGVSLLNKIIAFCFVIKMYLYHKKLYDEKKTRKKRKQYYLQKKIEIMNRILSKKNHTSIIN